MFVFPTPSKEVLEKIYEEDYFSNKGKSEFGYTDYDKDKEPMRLVFELYLDKLSRLTSGRNIFDVGAATGYFLDIAKKDGWHTYGSEISTYGKEEGEHRGHTMYLGSLRDVSCNTKMDVITMWDVLEHVDDPIAYVRDAKELLGSKGIIAINTVDASSLWARIMGMKWHLIVPPEHLNYFSRESLVRLLEAEGFEILEIKKIGKSFSLPYILKTLASWQGLAIWTTLAQWTSRTYLRHISLPINLFDNMFVIAKKRS